MPNGTVPGSGMRIHASRYDLTHVRMHGGGEKRTNDAKDKYDRKKCEHAQTFKKRKNRLAVKIKHKSSTEQKEYCREDNSFARKKIS